MLGARLQSRHENIVKQTFELKSRYNIKHVLAQDVVMGEGRFVPNRVIRYDCQADEFLNITNYLFPIIGVVARPAPRSQLAVMFNDRHIGPNVFI